MTTAAGNKGNQEATSQTNEALARRALAILATPLAARDLDEAALVFAPQARFGGPASSSCQSSTPVFDIEGAFSSLQIDIVDIEVDGDRVLARLSIAGRHTSQYRGFEASGDLRRAKGVVSLHVNRGRIDQVWCFLRWES